MREKRIAAKMDDFFCDPRLNIHALAMLTKRMLSIPAEQAVGDWFMAHKLAVDTDITGQEILDFTDTFDYPEVVDLSERSK